MLAYYISRTYRVNFLVVCFFCTPPIAYWRPGAKIAKTDESDDKEQPRVDRIFHPIDEPWVAGEQHNWIVVENGNSNQYEQEEQFDPPHPKPLDQDKKRHAKADQVKHDFRETPGIER